VNDFLPIMKTDITLLNDDKILMIDTKYYARTIQVMASMIAEHFILKTCIKFYAR
jgi:5-methylcytosine-specific restriction endonuclease McrBC regulatory subunit McrC